MSELERRKFVWELISEFYVDNEIQKDEYKSIASKLKATGLSLEELKQIDLYEVYPVVKYNLAPIPSVWTGFNTDWLYSKCIKFYYKRNEKWHRFITYLSSRFSYSIIQHSWEIIEQNWDK